MSSFTVQMFQMLSASPSRNVQSLSKTQATPSINNKSSQNSQDKISESSPFGQAYELELSEEAKRLSGTQSKDAISKVEKSAKVNSEKDDLELSEEEQAEVEKLKERDAEVKRHEQAHVAAAGAYAKGGPSYGYESGPDNQQYAVAGEVQIDTSKESSPEKTLLKAQVILKASLSPEEPSSADKQVAANAQKMAVEAKNELSEEDELSDISESVNVKESREQGEVDNFENSNITSDNQNKTILQYQKPTSQLGQKLNFVA